MKYDSFFLYKYPSCLITYGYTRSLIQDTFRKEFHFIPTWLHDILDKSQGLTIKQISAINGLRSEEMEEVIQFLISKDLICLAEDPIFFEKIKLNFEYPAYISNLILIINKKNRQDFLSEIISTIEILGCEYIQIYIEDSYDLDDLKNILTYFEKSRISYIEIIIPYHNSISKYSEINFLYQMEPRLFKILIHSAPFKKKYSIQNLNIKFLIFTITDYSYNDCGVIHPMLFKNNLPFFTESQKHNTCLNRKLCIDSGGNIKNCPAMKETFGNSKTDSLREVIRSAAFQELWHIPKDKIEICKDCEFRHMCMDCRAFITNPQNRFSQPQKCTYNPYICKWEGEEGYIPVAACGHYNDKDRFIPDRQKIEKINAGLWEGK